MSGGGTGLLVTRRNSVVTIVLNHPERANALDPDEFHDLAARLAAEAGAQGTLAVVLTGQGERAFCAGLNLGDRAAIQEDLASAGTTGLGAVLRAAAGLGVPLIGRINGACVAGGMGLLGACDVAIAVDTARFGLPEIRHGIVPHVALAGLHGRGATAVVRRLADTGVMIDAAAALEAKLIDAMFPAAGLDEAIAAQIDAIRSGRMPARFAERRAAGTASVMQRIDRAEARARQIRIVNS